MSEKSNSISLPLLSDATFQSLCRIICVVRRLDPDEIVFNVKQGSKPTWQSEKIINAEQEFWACYSILAKAKINHRE